MYSKSCITSINNGVYNLFQMTISRTIFYNLVLERYENKCKGQFPKYLETFFRAKFQKKSRSHGNKDVLSVPLENDHTLWSAEIWSFHLADESSHHDDEVNKSVKKWPDIQSYSWHRIFHSFYRISVITFLSHIKIAYDTDIVHEAGTSSLLHYFTKQPTTAVLSATVTLQTKSLDHQERGSVCETTTCL